MKFTKQEQSLIKLAAAHMAPQMLKKATLQDKLAEYGIGMSKKAETDASPNAQFTMELAKRLGEMNRAQAGKQPKLGPYVPSKGSLDRYNGANGGITNRNFPYAAARRDAYVHRNSGNGGFGGMEFTPSTEEVHRNVQPFDHGMDIADAQGLTGQQQVDFARKWQAEQLAREVSAPGTNQYDDAVRMLIQHGRNNQNAFENNGWIPVDKQNWNIQSNGKQQPAGYNGPNRLSPLDQVKIDQLGPAMGSTGNFRRFSNLS